MTRPLSYLPLSAADLPPSQTEAVAATTPVDVTAGDSLHSAVSGSQSGAGGSVVDDDSVAGGRLYKQNKKDSSKWEPSNDETVLLHYGRWAKLKREFFKPKKAASSKSKRGASPSRRGPPRGSPGRVS